jgi:hypothetical protein
MSSNRKAVMIISALIAVFALARGYEWASLPMMVIVFCMFSWPGKNEE